MVSCSSCLYHTASCGVDQLTYIGMDAYHIVLANMGTGGFDINIKWMYILLNDCDINILFGLSTRVICFCLYRAIFNLCAPLTQGVASLCPGLCAVCPFRAFPCSQEPGRFLAAKSQGVSLQPGFWEFHFYR